MRAIVRRAYGGPEMLEIREIPTPEPGPGQVLVRVRAFGLNRAEQYFRKGLWGEVAAVSGIECVGEVARDPSGRLAPGQAVFALMGGMGRGIGGSYAEYTCVPASSVVPIRPMLDWAGLAALPESYATAWSCLHDNLGLLAGDTVLVRGAGSALGRAAVDLARERGARVLASVRRAASIPAIEALGAESAWVEGDDLDEKVRGHAAGGLDAVLDLVGTRSVLGSLRMLRRGGRACMAGFLGGGEPLPAFDPLLHLPSGRHLSFFGSAFVYGTPDYPLAEIPFQDLVDQAAAGRLRARPAHVFRFDEIRQAHRLMDEQAAQGKMVVVVD